MATGLESTFDQQEGEDVFAVEESASTGYGSFEEALAAGQEAYQTEYSVVLQSAYDKLTAEQKELTKEWDEDVHNWSGRTHSSKRRQHPEVAQYLRIRDQDPTLNLDTVMRDLKSMGYKREDVDFYREGSAYREGALAQSGIIKDYLEQEDIPLYKELEDGTRLYLTTGTAAHMNSDSDAAKDGKWIQAGDVGTYSTYWEPKPKRSFLEGMISNPIFRTALAAATGGTSEVLIQAGRAISGEDLNSADWASMITGNDLASLAVKAAVTGDPKEFAMQYAGSKIGGDALKNSLGDIGIPQNLLDDPDFMAGINKTVGKVASGESIEDATKSGLSTYVREGGGFGVDLPDGSSFDIDLGGLGDTLNAFVESTEEVARGIGDVIDPALGVVGDVGSAIGNVIDPTLGAIGDAGSALDDTVRAGGRAVGDYLDPVWSLIGDNLVLTEGGAQAQQQQQRTPTQNLFDSELKSIGSISLSEYAPLLTGDQRRHAPVGTAANPARQQPQTAAESLLKPLSTQFAGQLAQDPVRQQMEKDRLASQGSLYGNFNSNPFASPFDTEEEEGLI